MRGLDGLPCALIALLAFAASAGDAPRTAAPIPGEEGGLFHAGLSAATLEHDGARAGLPFAGESFEVEAYGGFRLRDNLVLEVSAQSDDVAGLNVGAGLRTARLVVDGGVNIVSVKAVGDLARPELLSWPPSRPVFATVGQHHSEPRKVWDAGVAVQLSF